MDISVSTFTSTGKDNSTYERFLSGTMFYNRLILNKLGYVEENLDRYLNKLLLKYQHVKTSDLVMNMDGGELKRELGEESIFPPGKKVEYYSFLKAFDEVVTKQNLSKLTGVVYQKPVTLDNLDEKEADKSS